MCRRRNKKNDFSPGLMNRIKTGNSAQPICMPDRNGMLTKQRLKRCWRGPPSRTLHGMSFRPIRNSSPEWRWAISSWTCLNHSTFITHLPNRLSCFKKHGRLLYENNECYSLNFLDRNRLSSCEINHSMLNTKATNTDAPMNSEESRNSCPKMK